MVQSIVVCGAGTMGSGIAQVAAQARIQTVLFDLNTTATDKASSTIRQNLAGLVAKQKVTAGEGDETFRRITFTSDILFCKGDVVIEAIIEKEEPKISLFRQLAEINKAETIFASNTSSLSVSAIAKKITNPSRIAGMHFFNPAPLMKLVEIVKAETTSETTVKTLLDLAIRFGKTAVICKDSPGFIVNRIARHYYLEALLLAEQGLADFATIDDVLEEAGFKMGPFHLMDLIGNDINLAVTQSLYEAYDRPLRFKPSSLQLKKVADGELGKKTGKGYYNY